MKGIYNLKINKHDTIEDAREKNEKLVNMVKKLERKVKTLDTKNITLQRAFDKTEVFLKEVTDSVSLMEILEHVKKDKPLGKMSIECPTCHGQKLKKLQFDKFYIMLCAHCNYRKKVDMYDKPEEETE